MNPSISLTNAGVDTNVFNEADDKDPKRDFNVTLTPLSEFWLRMGRTWLNFNIREDLVWYKKYTDQRSGNSSYGLTWQVPLTRMSMNVSGTWIGTRERPGFEIDSRPSRSQKNVDGNVEIRALSRTLIGVRADMTAVDFDEQETFQGVNLHDELNRTSAVGAITLRHELTPLTSVTLDVSRSEDHFKENSLRDSHSTEATVGLKFDPAALINGSATFGYRKFTPESGDVAPYSGTTAAVSLNYVALGSTKLTANIGRSVQYSYDPDQPYYLQTGAQLILGQQIYGPLDVEGRLGQQRLSYRTREGADVDAIDRVDHAKTAGFGIGYHMGQNVRLAFNVDWNRRESDVANHRFHGLRYGTAITYGN
jgi:hypothetical protein